MSGQGTRDDDREKNRINLTMHQDTFDHLESELPHLDNDQERIRYVVQNFLKDGDQPVDIHIHNSEQTE